MAYVAINSAFLARVESKIRAMRGAELKTVGDLPTPNITPQSAFFLDLVWGEQKHLKDVLPDKWTPSHQQFRFDIVVGEHTFETRINTNTTAFANSFPPNTAWYDTYTIDVEQAKEYPELHPLIEVCQARAEIYDRWDAVETKVIGFLRECKSLNEAIKLWPDCKIYIQQSDLDRLEVKYAKPKEASRAAEALAALDTDELMGAAVIARLSGAEV